MSVLSTDIVARLRSHVGDGPTDPHECVKCAAAYEIEMLRGEIERLRSVTYRKIEMLEEKVAP